VPTQRLPSLPPEFEAMRGRHEPQLTRGSFRRLLLIAEALVYVRFGRLGLPTIAVRFQLPLASC
jgi:hypothetical protein